jgi:hypothetical protein
MHAQERGRQGRAQRPDAQRPRQHEKQGDAAEMDQQVRQVLDPGMVEANERVLDPVARDGDGHRVADLRRGELVQQWDVSRIRDHGVLEHEVVVVPVDEAEAERLHEAGRHPDEHERERDTIRARPVRAARARRGVRCLVGHGVRLYHLLPGLHVDITTAWSTSRRDGVAARGPVRAARASCRR